MKYHCPVLFIFLPTHILTVCRIAALHLSFYDKEQALIFMTYCY